MTRKSKVAADHAETSVMESEGATGSSLSGWGDVIRSMGEADRVRNDQEVATMRAALPERIAAIPQMNAVELLDTAIEMNRRSGNLWKKQQAELYEQYYNACRKELLARMGHAGE
jgi:hypothetical protein